MYKIRDKVYLKRYRGDPRYNYLENSGHFSERRSYCMACFHSVAEQILAKRFHKCAYNKILYLYRKPYTFTIYHEYMYNIIYT